MKECLFAYETLCRRVLSFQIRRIGLTSIGEIPTAVIVTAWVWAFGW